MYSMATSEIQMHFSLRGEMVEVSNSSPLLISLDSVRAGNAEAWSRVCDHFKVGLVAKANQLLRRNRIVKKIRQIKGVRHLFGNSGGFRVA